ncbi:tyrosine-type recombinase/integrase [Limisalsivibrio acetivorans]|uniref:tyrosine-type recombinase/integrase n=1 Tax=Limisalsivibrio acetivorans TaxID=1304888 RepID=UPI0003B66F54|nr:tyrosine-type recombinase/integrase [Limisalsivibrio acetivorans]
MALTDTVIKNAKPKDKNYKITDEKSMYLLVTKSGKYFRLDYRFHGRRKTFAIGVYPDISLKEARESRDEARKLIAKNIDPNEEKKNQKAKAEENIINSFGNVAKEWFDKAVSKYNPDTAKRKWHFLEKDALPYIGNRPINNITSRELLTVLNRIQNRGAIEIAHRVKGICGEIFRYGIITDRCDNDPSQALAGALKPKRNKNMATITEPKAVGALLRAIEDYQGSYVTICALKLLPNVFTRVGELRNAEWCEIDLDNAIWKIPAEKMKMNRIHMVPLSTQSVSILEDIQKVSGNEKYVFPSVNRKTRPMSNNTINSALRTMGFEKDQITGHGFRAMASTLLHENGWNSDIIEMQLAHAEKNKVKAAYNHAQYLKERTKMMQWWSDCLERLKSN